MAPTPDTGAEGFVVWIEGLPCSGKSTLAQSVSERLRAMGRKVQVLDGDEVRRMFSPELGFSRKDREVHARRVSYVARMLADQGTAVLVAMITPYETSRQAARAEVPERFIEVWLQCPVEVCQKRDTKGLYARAARGDLQRMTGMDDPFEEPLNPDLTVDTNHLNVVQSTDRILGLLSEQKLVPAIA
jgi:adenylylsulfate kinase